MDAKDLFSLIALILGVITTMLALWARVTGPAQQRFKQIEKQVKDLSSHSDSDLRSLKKLDRDTEIQEERIETLEMAMAIMMEHAIYGNSMDAIKDARTDFTAGHGRRRSRLRDEATRSRHRETDNGEYD